MKHLIVDLQTPMDISKWYANQMYYNTDALVIIFRQITTFIKVHRAFVFGLQKLQLIDFTEIYQLKCLEHKNKGSMNFYERSDLTKKYI